MQHFYVYLVVLLMLLANIKYSGKTTYRFLVVVGKSRSPTLTKIGLESEMKGMIHEY